MTATKLLHQALEARWKAAGEPPSATEQCLWDMEREIDDIERRRLLKDVLAEGVDLLEAWIESGDPVTEAESAALAQAKSDIAGMSA
jgi:hypothetical protein